MFENFDQYRNNFDETCFCKMQTGGIALEKQGSFSGHGRHCYSRFESDDINWVIAAGLTVVLMARKRIRIVCSSDRRFNIIIRFLCCYCRHVNM